MYGCVQRGEISGAAHLPPLFPDGRHKTGRLPEPILVGLRIQRGQLAPPVRVWARAQRLEELRESCPQPVDLAARALDLAVVAEHRPRIQPLRGELLPCGASRSIATGQPPEPRRSVELTICAAQDVHAMREIRSLWKTRFAPVILSPQRHEVERHLRQIGDRLPGSAKSQSIRPVSRSPCQSVFHGPRSPCRITWPGAFAACAGAPFGVCREVEIARRIVEFPQHRGRLDRAASVNIGGFHGRIIDSPGRKLIISRPDRRCRAPWVNRGIPRDSRWSSTACTAGTHGPPVLVDDITAPGHGIDCAPG